MEDLERMKYAELQKLAKKWGIKANMKADKLIKALREYQSSHAEVPTPKASSKSPKVPTPLSNKRRSLQGSIRNSPAVSKVATPKGIPSGTPSRLTPNVTGSSRRLSKSNTPMSGIKRLSSAKPATPASLKRKSLTPRRKTPSSAKRQSTGQASSERRRSSGRKRSNTYTLAEGTVPSPTVKELMDSMKEDMTNDQLKESLQSVLNKNSRSSVLDLKKQPTAIPRFAAFAMKKKAEAQKKTITPGNKDWAKIHQKEFDKMDSIDIYLEKKRKRTESISASVKKARLLAEQTKAAVNSLRSVMSPVNKDSTSKASLFKSPVPHTGVPFVPKVTSTTKMKTNFSDMKSPSASKTPKQETIKATVKSRSAGKENARKSPRVAQSRKSLGASAAQDRKSVNSIQNRTIAVAAPNRKSLSSSIANASRKSTTTVHDKTVTPFKLGTSLNQTLPDSQVKTKAKFDLKASLSRPMTWKPHAGKLKPVKQINLYAQKAGAFRVDPKAVKVQSKDDRRHAMKSHQANKRLEAQMKRRGINA